MPTPPKVEPGLAGFWAFYLFEHRNPRNRRLHFVGTTLALMWLLAGMIVSPWFLLAALANGYAFAWIGHFVFEKNRPATFRYPLRSFASDWILWYRTLRGQIPGELRRLGFD